MPELPEVETMCRGIAAICGRRIAAVTTPPCPYRPIAISPDVATIDARLRGDTVEQVSRIGKRVVIHTRQWALILQPKMAGLVAIEAPPDAEHVRLRIEFRGRPRLQLDFWDRRGLGTVQLIPAGELQQRIVDGRLGPDALSISSPDFAQRLQATRRPIKVALLDQKIVAGIGNLYASEMLHVARIHPQTPAAALTRGQLKKLYQAMQSILTTAIEHEGSTLADGTYRNALNDPGSYQNHHLVYARAQLACPTCRKESIQRIVQAQRSTFFCPRCQPVRTARVKNAGSGDL